MLWFGIIVGVLLLAVIVFLATPIRFRAVFNEVEQKISIRYFGVGLTADFATQTRMVDWLGLRLYRSVLGAPPKKKPKPRRKPKAKPKKPVRKTPLRQILNALFSHRRTIFITLKRALVFVARLVISPHLGLLRLQITAGSGNPAVTGMHYGWYQSVRPAWAAKRIFIDWQPVFDRAYFAAAVEGRVWLRPWDSVKHTVRFIFEIPKFALYRLYKDMKAKEA